MKKNLLLIGTTLFLFAGLVSLSSCGGSTEKKEEPKEQPAGGDSTKASAYICPMDDGGKGDAPGKCPKCGMDLVKNEKAMK